MLAKLYIPLPNNTELKSKTALEYVEFSSDELVMPEYGEVGSSKSIKKASSPYFLHEFYILSGSGSFT